MKQDNQNHCCPEGSEPAIQTNYVPQGNIKIVGDLPIYEIGSSENVIFVAYDFFGLENGSRIKQVCDQLSQSNFRVVIIDFYRGQGFPQDAPFEWGTISKFLSQFEAQAIVKDCQIVENYVKETGAKKIAMLGACWGCWATWHCMQQNKYVCGINWHPSVQLEQALFGRSQNDLAQGIQSPQLILTAGQDQPNMKAGGELVTILQGKSFGARVKTLDFPYMNHGWVVRGDLKQENVVRDIKIAINQTIQYLNESFK